MNRLAIPFAIALLLPVAGCGKKTTTPDGGTPQTDGPAPQPDLTGSNIPAPPALGTQMDRMGRPGVNTALTDPFDVAGFVNNQTEDQVKVAYNLNSDPTTWITQYKKQIASNIAIYAGVDTDTNGKGCNRQLLAGANVAAGRYDTLATVLADDELYVDTSNTTCGFYLGVEGKAAGLPVNDCGGRTPLYSTIHETYTLLVTGAAGFNADGTFAVTDGLPPKDQNTQSLTTFPFIADPN